MRQIWIIILVFLILAGFASAADKGEYNNYQEKSFSDAGNNTDTMLNDFKENYGLWDMIADFIRNMFGNNTRYQESDKIEEYNVPENITSEDPVESSSEFINSSKKSNKTSTSIPVLVFEENKTEEHLCNAEDEIYYSYYLCKNSCEDKKRCLYNYETYCWYCIYPQVQAAESSKIICGDKICSEREDCSTCKTDCTCGKDYCNPQNNYADQRGCVPNKEDKIICGNKICEAGETCDSCSDCSCASGEVCYPEKGDEKGCYTPQCGDGMCEKGEYCYSCSKDCKCPPGELCSPDYSGIGCRIF